MAPKMKLSTKAECVKVVVRCRPLSEQEIKQGHKRNVDMDVPRGTITSANPKNRSEPPRAFTYDSIYDWDSKQIDLYDETFRDLVDSVLQGFNGTIFAYGQTGTGKTFTMQGVKNDPELRGVIPNSFEHIFSTISRTENQQYLVRASYLEIYMEEIRDLLAKDQTRRLELKERPDTGIYVKDLSSFVTKSIKEIEHVMNVGNNNRSVGSTNMNEHSSRSHAIFIITIECSEVGADGENHIRVGKLNLVDLAGSERQAKTGSQGDRLKEATKINLSLSALGNVISALVDGKSTHIPYRDAKLTRLLQDSLGGNARTVMVANIGPADWNFDETLTTLRYANRAKNIKNKPKINEDPKDALLREFQEEIARLKSQLGGKTGGSKKKKHKRTRRGADGELIEESDSDSGADGEGDVEAYEQEQREKLEEQKLSILNNKGLIAEEKQKLLHEAEEKEAVIKREKDVKDTLAKKISAMESKLLVGGGNIVDHTNEQQRALEKRRHEIAEQKSKERELEQKRHEVEEAAENVTGNFENLQQEIEIKTKKLKKLFQKLQTTKQEIEDIKEEHSRERQELEQTQDELMRELKLKMVVIENFIPPEENKKLQDRAIYDDEEDCWGMKPLAKTAGTQIMAKRPVSALPGYKRPVSEHAKMVAAQSGNIRYKGENILLVELDMPNRTTRDYEGPTVAPKIQAALDAALADEEDIDLDASSVFKPKVRQKMRKSSSTGSSRPKSGRPQRAPEQFPAARGMVPKY